MCLPLDTEGCPFSCRTLELFAADDTDATDNPSSLVSQSALLFLSFLMDDDELQDFPYQVRCLSALTVHMIYVAIVL